MNFEPVVPETIAQYVFLNFNLMQIKGEYQFNYIKYAQNTSSIIEFSHYHI